MSTAQRRERNAELAKRSRARQAKRMRELEEGRIADAQRIEALEKRLKREAPWITPDEATTKSLKRQRDEAHELALNAADALAATRVELDTLRRRERAMHQQLLEMHVAYAQLERDAAAARRTLANIVDRLEPDTPLPLSFVLNDVRAATPPPPPPPADKLPSPMTPFLDVASLELP